MARTTWVTFLTDAPETTRSLSLSSLLDDGAIVRLNGVTVLRPTLPADDLGLDRDSHDHVMVDISDGITTRGVLFLGRELLPPAGLADGGVDLTEGGLGCESCRECP